jgi:hypothetical protein
VDGTSKGKTPLQIQLPAGLYNIKLTLRSYKDWEKQVRLRGARTQPLYVPLDPDPKSGEWVIGDWNTQKLDKK